MSGYILHLWSLGLASLSVCYVVATLDALISPHEAHWSSLVLIIINRLAGWKLAANNVPSGCYHGNHHG